jgi:hypothetical protein
VRQSPEHISVYLLEMDKPHELARLARERPELFPGEDATARQYLAAGRALVAAGYRHYEISNFARPGRAARHNTRYWRGRTVLAAGVAPDDSRKQTGYRHFASNLEAMLQVAARAGCPVILSTVASNLRDCAPFASLHAAGLSAVDILAVVVQSPDIDGDRVPNSQDAFPNDPKEWKDSNGNGIGDNAEGEHGAMSYLSIGVYRPSTGTFRKAESFSGAASKSARTTAMTRPAGVR